MNKEYTISTFSKHTSYALNKFEMIRRKVNSRNTLSEKKIIIKLITFACRIVLEPPDFIVSAKKSLVLILTRTFLSTQSKITTYVNYLLIRMIVLKLIMYPAFTGVLEHVIYFAKVIHTTD